MKKQTKYRQFGAMGEFLACLCLVWMAGVQAHASAAILLEQPYGELGRVYPAGHSAVYLDHICAASPTLLRPCREGELGVVLSRYDGISGYDWLAMPLVPYLYAVESPDAIPGTMDKLSEVKLRDAYRRAHLESVAPDLADGTTPEGNWYELVGSAYDRTIYGFSVKTTPEQDAKLIAQFNDRKNVQRYNGEFVNCADFVRVTINRFYPHAIRRNFIADLGMTSPKSVARGLSHYAKKHPETEFVTFVVPQVKGALPRSHGNVDFAEGLLKQYAIPIAIVSPVSVGVVAAAYVFHGRFSMPKNAPVLNLYAPPQVEASSLTSPPVLLPFSFPVAGMKFAAPPALPVVVPVVVPVGSRPIPASTTAMSLLPTRPSSE